MFGIHRHAYPKMWTTAGDVTHSTYGRGVRQMKVCRTCGKVKLVCRFPTF